jgi:hypothetical protein
MIHPSTNSGRAVLSFGVSEWPACAREHKNIQDADPDPVLDINGSTSKGVGAWREPKFEADLAILEDPDPHLLIW